MFFLRKSNYFLYKFIKYKHILEFFNLDKNSQVCQVLFKSSKRKKLLENILGVHLPDDSELLSIVDFKETYDSTIYKPKKLL